LQLVALPAGSPSALQLLQTLAAKACDKDAAVAAAALELLVQLDSVVLCSSLTAEQFVAVAQVGLEACSISSSSSSSEADGRVNSSNAAEEADAAEASGLGADGLQIAGGTQKPVIANRASSSKKRPASAVAAAGTTGKAAAGGKVLLSQAGQQQFLQLLRDVLMCDAAAAQHSQQQLRNQGVRQWLVSSAGRAAGVGGCRQLLLMLLQDEALEPTCSALSGSLFV
jgi:hypothetical protein